MPPYQDSFILLYTDYLQYLHNDLTNKFYINNSLNTKFCSVLEIFGNDSVACLLAGVGCFHLYPGSLVEVAGKRPHFSVQRLARGCLQALCTLALHKSVLKHWLLKSTWGLDKGVRALSSAP